MLKIGLWLAVGLSALSCAAAATAGTGTTITTHARIVDPAISAQHPGRAIIDTHRIVFRSIDWVCLTFRFDSSNPLDPGESFGYAPELWFYLPGGPALSGFLNGWTFPQYERTSCTYRQMPEPEGAFTPNDFVRQFLDGKATLRLIAEQQTSVTLNDLTVQIEGTLLSTP